MARTKYTNPMDSRPGLGASGTGRSNSANNGNGGAHIGGLKPAPVDPSFRSNGVSVGNNYPTTNQSDTEFLGQDIYPMPVSQVQQPVYQHGSVECIYAIRSIMETDLTNYSLFRKLSEGIPMFCNVKYNLSLVETGSGVHHGSGQQLNAVIYGKILNAVLNPQDLVRVKGRYKKGVFVVNQIYSENFGQYLNIKKTWNNPDKVAIGGKKPTSPVPFVLVGLIVLLALLYFSAQYLLQVMGKSVGGFSNMGSTLSTALIIGVLLVGLYMNRGRIFQSKAFMIIFLMVIAVLVVKFIPGGEGLVTEIATLVITVGGLYLILKGLFR